MESFVSGEANLAAVGLDTTFAEKDTLHLFC
jgi:hypothetical protein